MKSKISQSLFRGIFLSCVVIPSLSAASGADGQVSSRLSAGFTAGGELEYDGVKSEELQTSVMKWDASYDHAFSDTLSFRFGAAVEQTTLDYDGAGSPLPETLRAISAEFGASWHMNANWILGVRLEPGVYGDDEVDSGDAFTVPAMLTATWVRDENLVATVGLRYSPFSDSEVMPVINVRWRINPDWALVLGVPRTEIRYLVSDRLAFFAGASLEGGSYAVDDPAVVAPAGHDLRDTKLSVTEIHGVLGVDYTLSPWMKLELTGGYAFSREFDYHERDVKFEADGAASASLSLSFSF